MNLILAVVVFALLGAALQTVIMALKERRDFDRFLRRHGLNRNEAAELCR
ncbi:MAG: hypothetical protein JRM99_04260 [Nitrososphaerota archaeon]|nr:hypothetical protein [Nitrososphaerota archaeon]